MGLDMYLNKKNYVGGDNKKLTITGVKNIDTSKVSYIIEEAGYWRKANCIHKWFVNNCQNGVDDCREYYVGREDLKELLSTVNKVLKHSKLIDGTVENGSQYKNGKMEPILEKGKVIKDPTMAKKLLPREKGFFFGGEGYDGYYVEDLKHN